MMALAVPESEHKLVVSGWHERIAPARSVESLLQAFEAAFAALWQRSYLVLGEVTLTAIVERVLHTATERYPVLASLDVEASGLRCQQLRSHAGLRRDELSPAVQFLLVEFLTVLGNLTAEILTPALHAELSKVHASASASGTSEDEAS